MSKNIVLCLDGTGNRFSGQGTNVQSTYECLANGEDQIAYYDAGVGTFEFGNAVTSMARKWQLAMGLAFGLGLKENVLDAYAFIMQNYAPGDRIYIFGFSRGAYTARVVAALVKAYGVLRANHLNLLPYALMELDNSDSHWPDFRGINAFRKTFSADKDAKVRFLGLWDTVASVSWVFRRQRYMYTRRNDAVETIRHAVSLDERRAFFRTNRIEPAQGQDVKEVWFAGVHSDVGGGYPRGRSAENEGIGLAQMALEWMLVEARQHDLRLDDGAVETRLYAPDTDAPNPLAPRHRSLAGPWWACEIWPKRIWDKWLPRPNLAGRRSVERYLEHDRRLGARQVRDVVIHASLKERVDAGDRPSNLARATTTVEPRERYDGAPTAPSGSGAPVEFVLPRSIGARLKNAAVGAVSIVGLLSVLGTAIVLLRMLWDAGVVEGVTGAFLWLIWAPFLPLAGNYLFGTALVFAWPLAFVIGARLCKQGLTRERSILTEKQLGPILHRRAAGYSRAVIADQFKAIRSRGRRNYRRALLRDFFFMAIYGGAFYAVWQAAGGAHGWMLSLMVIGIVADVIEDGCLLALLARYQPDGAVSRSVALIARMATSLKSISIGLAGLAITAYASGVVSNMCSPSTADVGGFVWFCHELALLDGWLEAHFNWFG